MSDKPRPKQSLLDATDEATNALLAPGMEQPKVLTRNKVRIGDPTTPSANLTNQIVKVLRNRGQ
jgi:hypothetical protein